MQIKRVIVDQVTILPNGVLQVRLQKQVVEDTTGEVISFRYHRTECEPFIPWNRQLDMVERAIERDGWPAIEQTGRDFVESHALLEQTPAKAQARRADLDARQPRPNSRS